MVTNRGLFGRRENSLRLSARNNVNGTKLNRTEKKPIWKTEKSGMDLISASWPEKTAKPRRAIRVDLPMPVDVMVLIGGCSILKDGGLHQCLIAD